MGRDGRIAPILVLLVTYIPVGLEASDVRNAQAEFRKFDMENNG